DPAARHPSMDALLAALARDPRRPWRWALGGLAVALVAGAAIVTLRPARPCQGAERALARVWDAPIRAQVEQAFARSGAPHAAETWQRFATGLDAYAARWVERRVEICEATRVRGEQSDALLDLRMSCADRRLDELRALAALYLHADADLVAQAP